MIESEEELFREFLGLAEGLAGQFCRKWIGLVDPDDIKQEARLELVRAIRVLRCRESAGPFIATRIKGRLAHWLRDRSRLVRVPRRLQEGAWVPVKHDSLDQPLAEEGTTWLDVLPAPEDQAREETEEQERIEALLDQIPAHEAAVIRLSLLQGRTLADAGRDLGISRQAASRRAKLGIQRLREALAEG